MTPIDLLLVFISILASYWFGCWSTTQSWIEIVESHKRMTALYRDMYEAESRLVMEFIKKRENN